MQEHIVIGLDTGKDVFHLLEANRHGGGRVRRKFTRRRLISYLSNHEKSLIGLEACAGSHHLARKLGAFGHTVRLMGAQHVRPYVMGGKNDFNDAAGAWEAVQRPRMRYVPVKTVAQQELCALHRARALSEKLRTAVSNQIRGILGEFGIVVAKGVGSVKRRLPEVLEDADNELTPGLRRLLAELGEELHRLDERFARYTRALRAESQGREECRRLETIPGIGPMVATATVARSGDGQAFRNGRHHAAWMGLVPRQFSTGGKPRLGPITKRGDAYLRTMYVHGARALLQVCKRRPDDPLCRWATELEARVGWNKAVVALANKLARIAFVVLTRGVAYDPKRLAV
jgi:transposase